MVRLPNGARKLDEGEGVSLYEMPPDPRKKYPVWRIDALQADIDRAEAHKEQFQAHIDDLNRTIEERKDQIKLCEERDRAIARWERDRANSDFPPGE